jgi:site-specific DNA-cytosine methylase
MVIGDASKVTGGLIQEALGAIKASTPIDVVFGGPPCQGMSSSGKQNPADPRNNLVLEFVRIADELGAEMFVMENVPPLVTQAKFRPLFNALVDRAHAAGFTVTANVLDAANYGVPQRRRRAFVVGARGEANARPFSFAMPTNWAFVAEPGGERTDFLIDEIEAPRPAPRSKKRSELAAEYSAARGPRPRNPDAHGDWCRYGYGCTEPDACPVRLAERLGAKR